MRCLSRAWCIAGPSSEQCCICFGFLQRFKHLLLTSRDPAVPFPSAAPRLALSSPKNLSFSSCGPEKGAGLGSYSWLVRWPRMSAVLSLGERVLTCTGGKHSGTGTVSQSCPLFVNESDGYVAWAWFTSRLSWHPAGLDSDGTRSWTDPGYFPRGSRESCHVSGSWKMNPAS